VTGAVAALLSARVQFELLGLWFADGVVIEHPIA
jgi:hypothetical protein